jgi:ribulose-phosphate 3-epimerase
MAEAVICLLFIRKFGITVTMDSGKYFAPSLLSADFTEIKKAAELIETAGGDFVHIDVMDGVFVPNLTFGHKMVRDLRKRTALPLDVHLMVVNPEEHIPRFAEAGADYISFHYEATVHVHRALQLIIDAGIKPGVSIVPSTPVAVLSEIIDMLDMVLVMSVNPGFGGQKIIPRCLEKVQQLVRLREEMGLDFLISLDGGINPETAEIVRNAGTDVFVCGSAFFGAEDPASVAKAVMGKN